MMNVQCAVCEKPLSGGVDTFGDVHAPLCWDCFSAYLDEELNVDGSVPIPENTAPIPIDD